MREGERTSGTNEQGNYQVETVAIDVLFVFFCLVFLPLHLIYLVFDLIDRKYYAQLPGTNRCAALAKKLLRIETM